jgi:hypothetical protein
VWAVIIGLKKFATTFGCSPDRVYGWKDDQYSGLRRIVVVVVRIAEIALMDF